MERSQKHEPEYGTHSKKHETSFHCYQIVRLKSYRVSYPVR